MMSVGSDLGICLEDNGEGLIPDNDCISCMQPPKQGCADGYIMHDVPLNNSCTQIICTRPGKISICYIISKDVTSLID